MAAIVHSPLQNWKWPIIRNKYTKQLPKVVFGCSTYLEGFILQNSI